MKSDAIAFGLAGVLFGLLAGWIIALAVIHGAGRRTIWLLPVSLAATAAVLAVGEYALLLRALNEAAVAAGRQPLPPLQPAGRIASILIDGALQDPLIVVFGAVALGAAAVVPWRHVIPPPPRPWQPVF